MAEDGEINRLPCVFGKAVLAQCAVCELARRVAVGDGDTLACSSPLARAACGTLFGLLREKSAFALGVTTTQRILKHALVLRIQCGGLAGFKQVIDPAAHAADVHRLVRAATEQYGSLDALPFSEIVQGVAAWRGRKRKS